MLPNPLFTEQLMRERTQAWQRAIEQQHRLSELRENRRQRLPHIRTFFLNIRRRRQDCDTWATLR